MKTLDKTMRRDHLKDRALQSMFTLFLSLSFLFAEAQDGHFRMDSQNSGYYNESFSNFTNLKWKFKTKGMIFSTPIVSGGSVFFGSNDSCFYALDTASGVMQWKFKTGGIVSSSPAVKDTVLYLLSMDSLLYALNTKTGEELWHFKTGGEYLRSEPGLFGTQPADLISEDPWDLYLSSPLVVDTLVYFGSSDSNIYAVSINTHNLLWKFKTGKGVHSTPAYYDGKILCGSWDSKLYALNALTGGEIWSYQTGTDNSHLMEGIQASPAVSDGVVYLASRDNFVYALKVNDGSLIWQKSFGGSWMPSSPAFDADNIYIGSSDAKQIFCMNKKTGSYVYIVNVGNYCFASPAITDEWMFEGFFNGRMYGIEKQSGKIRWEFQPALSIQNYLGLSNVSGSFNVTPLYKFDYSKAEAQAQYLNEVYKTGPIISSPVIAGGIVYFTSADSNIYALEGATIDADDVELGEMVKDTVVNFDITTSVNRGDYDSVTISVKSNSESQQEAFAFTPATLQFKPIEQQTFHTTLDTKVFPASKLTLALYVDYWQKGIRNRAIVYVSLTLTQPAVTSLQDREQEHDILECYPNPFTHNFTLSYTLEKGSNVEITVLNSMGMEVLSRNEGFKVAGKYRLLMNYDLPEGIYVLRFFSSGKEQIKKLVCMD